MLLVAILFGFSGWEKLADGGGVGSGASGSMMIDCVRVFLDLSTTAYISSGCELAYDATGSRLLGACASSWICQLPRTSHPARTRVRCHRLGLLDCVRVFLFVNYRVHLIRLRTRVRCHRLEVARLRARLLGFVNYRVQLIWLRTRVRATGSRLLDCVRVFLDLSTTAYNSSGCELAYDATGSRLLDCVRVSWICQLPRTSHPAANRVRCYRLEMIDSLRVFLDLSTWAYRDSGYMLPDALFCIDRRDASKDCCVATPMLSSLGSALAESPAAAINDCDARRGCLMLSSATVS